MTKEAVGKTSTIVDPVGADGARLGPIIFGIANGTLDPMVHRFQQGASGTRTEDWLCGVTSQFDQVEALGRRYVVESGQFSHEWKSLFDRVEALGKLGEDWNTYGAPAPNEEAIASARATLEAAHEKALVPNEILPSVEGGVVVQFSTATGHADIESLNDGTMLAMTSSPPRDPRAWPVRNEPRAIEDALEEIREFVAS